ncbi:cytochrome c oxidase assembly protein COX11, mitochondrial isoform X2 [Palaemon carinicauda]|uniref:cytochrome c oxidase assembly protein COX11, mitochondrial isoform X2 n=1 Tax=Palaemon carinicauda TaxID=392227 RepID=UPI0035B63C46
MFNPGCLRRSICVGSNVITLRLFGSRPITLEDRMFKLLPCYKRSYNHQIRTVKWFSTTHVLPTDKSKARGDRNPFGTPKSTKSTLYYIAALGVATLGLSYAAVPLYRIFCQVLPGETALAFYTACNPTERPVIGVSTYNVIPFDAGQYFNKIQCFCFEEQLLNPHEVVHMPVFFYIDPEFVDDPKMENVNQLTLSYTFFEAREGVPIPIPNFTTK